jgi:dTDP-4-dehydrorhamnose reductase
MRVAVLGSRGQLGAAIVHEFAARHEVSAFDHAALDVIDAAAVEGAIHSAQPDVILNCAAYNAVDEAEDRPMQALQVNAFGVRNIARAAATAGARLVHFSSDFVFDGTETAPHAEADRPNPRSVYGASKLMGEWFAADAPGAYVVRVESLFGRAPDGPPAKGSAATIINDLAIGRAVRVFSDRTVSPTYVIDAARAIARLVERDLPPGLYHCVNSGHCTWLEFAQKAATLLGVEPRLDVVTMADVAFRAVRPQYCALSNAKLASAGVHMPIWDDALARYLVEVRHDLAHELSDRQR